MKHLLIPICACMFMSARSQSVVISKADTLIYHSEILRNNLSGQKVISLRGDGIVYQLQQDGMACFAPKKEVAALMPNAVVPRMYYIPIQPKPPVHQKKELPKFQPKKPRSF